jgi:hypothetical protein
MLALSRMLRNLLILAPHPDDEIFCLPHAKYLESLGYSITVLFLSSLEYRRLEARKACHLMDWQCLFADEMGVYFPDGLFHRTGHKLIKYLERVTASYSAVLCPALEGGHQDHDTVFIASQVMAAGQSTFKLFFYKTYTAMGIWKLFKVSSRRCQYSGLNLLTYHTLCNHYWRQRLKLCIFIYKSQWITWFALFPAMVFSLLIAKREIIYTLPYTALDPKKLEALIDNLRNPLYELHGRCSKNEWSQCLLTVLRYHSHSNI